MPLDSDNKRLAKNTIYLYIRMLLTMLVGLYTSRVILQVLGASDYGLFNVVGGMATMFSFINTALTGGTSRFLTIAIGTKNDQEIEHVFRVSLALHMIVGVVFLIVIEVIGFFLIQFVINIPEGRDEAAGFVFQMIAIAVCLDLVRILMDSSIIAHEKMDYYAYISILEVFLKFVIVYVIMWIDDIDKLKLYSLLYLTTNIVVLVVVSLYCKSSFKECQFRPRIDKKLIKEIGIYTIWNVLPHISYLVSMQGVNIALNVFFGTVMNAARGLSVQINGAVSKLTSNYQIATVPQIIKLYAAEEIDDMYMLVKNVSRFSFYLYLIIAVPLFLEMDSILEIWLIEVPPHTAMFSRILLLQGGITVFGSPVTRILVATGKIKKVNLFDFFVQATTFLLMIIMFLCKINVEIVMTSAIVPSIVVFLYYLSQAKLYTGIRTEDYFKKIIPHTLFVLLCVLILPVIAYESMKNGIIRLFVIFFTNLVSVIVTVYFFGIEAVTRKVCMAKIKNILTRFFN